MPVTITAQDDGGVVVIFHGIVRGDEFLEAARAAYRAGANGHALYQLADLTDVKAFNVSREEIHALVALDLAEAKANPGLLIATCGKKDIVFGLSRMWQLLTDVENVPKPRTAVFRTAEEGMAWIKAHLSTAGACTDAGQE